MPITPNFRKSDIQREFDKFLNTVDRQILNRLQYLGEMCVKHAREVPAETGFTDQTGNLRSSIGYVVFKDGRAIHENYQQVAGGAEGVRKGRELAASVARENADGYLLVVTAGMEYALQVESRGRDVLTSAENLAERELPRMLQALKKSIDTSLL